MSADKIDALVEEYRRSYGPLITAKEAAEISKREPQTLYDWSSRGLLDAFKVKRRGALLLTLDGFVRFLFETDAQ